jgi:Ca-activated chloride channel family protein
MMLPYFTNKRLLLSGVLGAVMLASVACGGSAEPVAEAPAPRQEVEIAQEAEPLLEAEPEATMEEAMEEEAMAEEAPAEAMADTAEEPAPAPQATAVAPATGGTNSPNDAPYDSMFFESEGVNPFVDTEDDHFSTFAMDVDTGSYSVARRYLSDGYLPPEDAIRVEEFINYFDMNYPGPSDERDAFAIHMEGAPAPFGPEKAYLLKIDLQGKEISVEERKDAVLTFVIDVSGSMEQENRLGLVKESLRLLVEELRPSDAVGIVVYGSEARLILEPTSAQNKNLILSAIDRLQPEGATNAEDGLRLGYQIAAQDYRPEAINRVILLSDGVANVGNTGPASILQVIQEQVEQGITLSTVGVGMGNYNDVLMEQLADDGDGNYAYVDTLEEAHRIFVEILTGTLQVIAKDAKVQIDFNPDVVRSYRLLGYENRAVADRDFRNDTVDAGEVGAGHSVTALYEIKFHDEADIAPTDLALITYIRYEDIDSGQIVELAQPLTHSDFAETINETSPQFRFIAAVAEYAEILRGSYWAQDGDLNTVQLMVLSTAQDLGHASRPDVVEFMGLLNEALEIMEGSGI